ANEPYIHINRTVLNNRPASRRSIGIPVYQDGRQGPGQNLDVKPQGPVVDVVDIVLDSPCHLLRCFRLTPAATDLCPAGDSRPHSVAGRVPVEYQFQRQVTLVRPEFRSLGPNRMRPRADKGHVATQNVEQLGQFVEAGAPEKPADLRYPPVAL